jgi:hypothetical protein
MGWILDKTTDSRRRLEPEHFVGRGLNCSLCIPERYVSAQHALVRWNGERWEVKDLGSRNGTFVNGVRVRPGEELPVRQGARIAFGKIEREWELVDETAPSPMAVPTDGGEAVLGDDDFIVLPSPEDPRVTLYRNAEGSWVLEQPNEASAPIASLQNFEVDGRTFRFCCPQNILKTSIAEMPMEVDVRNIRLQFSVSRDEEHVQLRVECPSKTHDIGARAPNYLLLTLARRRMADAAEGLPETSCGWIYQEDLAHDPSMAGPQLNIDVFRIRKQFGALGISDAANIIERRPRTHQLRIGTGRLSVVIL